MKSTDKKALTLIQIQLDAGGVFIEASPVFIYEDKDFQKLEKGLLYLIKPDRDEFHIIIRDENSFNVFDYSDSHQRDLLIQYANNGSGLTTSQKLKLAAL